MSDNQVTWLLFWAGVLTLVVISISLSMDDGSQLLLPWDHEFR